MIVKAKLWSYEPNNEGQCDVKLYIRHKGTRKYKSLEIKIHPKYWDDKSGLIKRSHPLSSVFNAKIQQEVNHALEFLITGGTVSGMHKKSSGSFIAFVDKYVEDLSNGITEFKPGTVKNYQSFRRIFHTWLKNENKDDISFAEINMDFYENFKVFMLSNGSKLNGGFSKHIKMVKAVMSVSKSRGLHSCNVHEHKDFKRHATATEKIYLTQDEIDQILSVNLNHNKSLEIERDRFVVSYYLILRYGDSVKIKEDHFFDIDDQKYYHNIAEKTGEKSVLPVKPSIWKILLKRKFNLAGDTNQEANRKLKTIAALAGIQQEVSQDGKVAPKWSFVTTHTARRSAATNLSLMGVSHQLIADLGGWRSLKSFESYLRNSNVESAQAVKDHPFFQ